MKQFFLRWRRPKKAKKKASNRIAEEVCVCEAKKKTSNKKAKKSKQQDSGRTGEAACIKHRSSYETGQVAEAL